MKINKKFLQSGLVILLFVFVFAPAIISAQILPEFLGTPEDGPLDLNPPTGTSPDDPFDFDANQVDTQNNSASEETDNVNFDNFGNNNSNSSSIGGNNSNCSVIGGDGKKTVGSILDYATCVIVSSVVPLLFAAALVVFIWGVIKYVMNPADETKRAEGKMFMVWGLIALTVMFGVWGLVEILGNSFGIDTNIVPGLNTN